MPNLRRDQAARPARVGPSRRDLLRLAAAGGAAALVGGRVRAARAAKLPPRMPVLFVGHGLPVVPAPHDAHAEALRRFVARIPKPKAVVLLSAHYVEFRPLRLATTAGRFDVAHDAPDAPPALQKLNYTCPGARALADDIREEMRIAQVPAQIQPHHLDQGAYLPLRIAFPRANVPLIEVSMWPSPHPVELVRLGTSFAFLRRRGVLLIASGGVVNNLALMKPEGAPPEPWATAFDGWVRDRVAERDVDGLAAYRERGPDAARAMPTSDHLDPLFWALGATDKYDKVTVLHEGIRHGTISMRTFAFEGSD